MSILIKGVKMPKGEKEGLFIAIHDGKAYRVGTKEELEAVEVPIPHGDLIDANDLYAKFYKLEQDAVDAMRKFPIGSVGWQEANTILNERTAYKHDVADAPTVIEAEVEE